MFWSLAPVEMQNWSLKGWDLFAEGNSDLLIRKPFEKSALNFEIKSISLLGISFFLRFFRISNWNNKALEINHVVEILSTKSVLAQDFREWFVFIMWKCHWNSLKIKENLQRIRIFFVQFSFNFLSISLFFVLPSTNSRHFLFGFPL